MKNHSGLALFTNIVNEPVDFPSIYRKLISAWGSYHYKTLKEAIDKMTNSPHEALSWKQAVWLHMLLWELCRHHCQSNPGPSVVSCPWVGGTGAASLVLTKCAKLHHLVHPTDALP